jgi:hypothetical protein
MGRGMINRKRCMISKNYRKRMAREYKEKKDKHHKNMKLLSEEI